MLFICDLNSMNIQKRLTVIGLKIKTKRIELGIKPKDLAKKLEISVNTLYTIESGMNPNPTFKVLATLQDQLQIPTLFDYEHPALEGLQSISNKLGYEQPATNEPIG